MIPFPYSRALLTRRRVSGATDPNFANVSLLLHMNGTNGSISFTDNSPNNFTISVLGDAQVNTSIVKYGSGSLVVDGAGDYLTAPSDVDFDMGTGDFTYEAWIYPTSVSGSFRTILSRQQTGDTAPAFQFRITDTSKLQAVFRANGGSAATVTSSGNISANTWTHVALVRSGSTARLFIGGSQDGSGTITTNYNPTSSQALSIGGLLISSTPSAYFVGYIDDLRITKGVARYTANFTPPTAQFPDS